MCCIIPRDASTCVRMEQERLEQLEPKLKALRDEIGGLEEEIEHYNDKHQKTVEEKEELNRMIKVVRML